MYNEMHGDTLESGWKVHVKVLHIWKQYNPLHRDILEVVLSEENVSFLVIHVLLIVFTLFYNF